MGIYPVLSEPAQKSMREAEISQLAAVHWQPFQFRCLSAITRISINSSQPLRVAGNLTWVEGSRKTCHSVLCWGFPPHLV